MTKKQIKNLVEQYNKDKKFNVSKSDIKSITDETEEFIIDKLHKKSIKKSPKVSKDSNDPDLDTLKKSKGKSGYSVATLLKMLKEYNLSTKTGKKEVLAERLIEHLNKRNIKSPPTKNIKSPPTKNPTKNPPTKNPTKNITKNIKDIPNDDYLDDEIASIRELSIRSSKRSVRLSPRRNSPDNHNHDIYESINIKKINKSDIKKFNKEKSKYNHYLLLLLDHLFKLPYSKVRSDVILDIMSKLNFENDIDLNKLSEISPYINKYKTGTRIRNILLQNIRMAKLLTSEQKLELEETILDNAY